MDHEDWAVFVLKELTDKAAEGWRPVFYVETPDCGGAVPSGITIIFERIKEPAVNE